MAGLKRVAVFGAAFGAAAILTAAVVVGVVSWYRSRPEPWRTDAFLGLSATASETFNYNPQSGEMKHSGFTFTFVLESKTNEDYTVPETLKLFKRDKKSLALAEFEGKVRHSFLVPARERAEINVYVEYSCSTFDETNRETMREAQTCFNDAFADVGGFIGLDHGAKVRLKLPKPVWGSGQAKDERKKARGSQLLAPDKGDIFDQVAGCEEADRLLNECKSKSIKPDKPWLSHGGFSKPLPTLPVPPRGYKLEASESVCRTAAEWKNFCRQQK